MMNYIHSIQEGKLLPQQQAVFDHWRSQCITKLLPSHKDINPAQILGCLPMVTLTEVIQGEEDPRFKLRLAGTGFYNIYDRELTGLYLEDIHHEDRQNYWSRIYRSLMNSRRPRVGAVLSDTRRASHMVQSWLRLPLSCDGENINMILGLDVYITKKQLKRE